MDLGDHNGWLGWPPEMQVRVSVHSKCLLELMWIRHRAMGSIRPDLPAADLSAVDQSTSAPGEAAEWDALWSRSLDEAREYAVRIPTFPAPLPISPCTAPIRALARRLRLEPEGPVTSWAQTLPNNLVAEFANAEELLIAWRGGLRFVIDLPFAGETSVKVSDDTVIVSTPTRADPSAYLRALSGFTRR